MSSYHVNTFMSRINFVKASESEVGDGTKYPIEVTLDQLAEIFYRVRKTKFVSGNASISAGYTSFEGKQKDVYRGSYSLNVAPGTPPTSDLALVRMLGGSSAYYSGSRQLVSYCQNGVYATDYENITPDVGDIDETQPPAVYKEREPKYYGSGTERMAGTQAANYFGELYATSDFADSTYNPGYGHVIYKARDPVGEPAMWTQDMCQPHLFNAFCMSAGNGRHRASFRTKYGTTGVVEGGAPFYGFVVYKDWNQHQTYYLNDGGTREFDAQESWYVYSAPEYSIYHTVSFVGDSVMCSDTRFFLGVDFHIVLRAPLTGGPPDLILILSHLNEETYRADHYYTGELKMVDNSHFLNIKLSGGQIVKHRIYAYLRTLGYTTGGNLSFSLSKLDHHSLDSLTDFTIEATEWWSYCGTWNTATGERIVAPPVP